MRVPLIRAELDLVTRAVHDLISLGALDWIVTVCAWCGRALAIKAADGQPGVSHGICDACNAREEARHAH